MNNSKTMIRDFTEGSVAKKLIAFATPLFLSNLLQVVYNMVDMMVVGKELGKVGLSAVSVGGDVSMLLTFIAMGFSTAAQIIISQLIGAEKRERIGAFIGTMTTFLGSLAIIGTLIGVILRGPLLSMLSTPAEAWKEAMDYSVTCAVGLIFIYGYNSVSAILRGMGDSRHPFVFISIAAVLNIVLDILFVIVLKMNAFGAALATVISQAVSFLSALIFLYRRRRDFGFEITARCFIPDKELLMTLVKLGVPMAIKNAAVQASRLFVNSWINSYGVTVSAVAGIGHKINKISNTIASSLNMAGSSMVGQNIGAKKFDRVPRILITTFGINLAISALMAGAIFFWPEQIFMLFTDDTSILPVALQYVPVALLIFFACASRSPMNALLNGSGNYKINFAVALFDGIIMRLGLAIVLGLVLDMGYMGFWYGDAVAGFTPFVIGIVYYLSGTWKTRKYVVKD